MGPDVARAETMGDLLLHVCAARFGGFVWTKEKQKHNYLFASPLNVREKHKVFIHLQAQQMSVYEWPGFSLSFGLMKI